MALVCPDCRGLGLVISHALELPDSRSDEITLQIVHCAACGLEALAVYEESRRGGFDSDLVDHRAHAAAPELVSAVRKMIVACPNQGNARCRCATHRALAEVDSNGRWIGLQRCELGSRMPIAYRKD